MYLLPIKSKILFLFTIFYCQNSFGQNVGIGTNNPLTRLHITGGSDASLGGGGFLQIGNLNALNVVIDDNEIMARINGSAATLSLNNDGGNIILGAAEGANIGIGTNAPAERLHIAAGNIRLDNSLLGINLHGADRAMITRRFDVFTSGIHQGLGRWGLFMEPSRLTIGIPDIVGKAFQVASYSANSVANTVLTIDRVGQVKRPKTGDFDLLPIGMAYIKWDGSFWRSTGNISVTFSNSGNYWKYEIRLIPEGPVQFANLTMAHSDYLNYMVYGDFGATVFTERKSDTNGVDFTIILY
jgi:hypothetical protein